MQWQAHRSSGEWFDRVMKAVLQIHDHGIISQFTSSDFSTVSAKDDSDGRMEPWMQEEVDRINNFFELLIELASARAWSQMLFVSCFPFGLAAVLHEDAKVADQMLAQQRVAFQAILSAEDVVTTKNQKVSRMNTEEVAKRLSDISFQNFQLCREVYGLCEQCGWASQHPEIQQIARLLFGGPCETKYNLEDLFAHLVSVSKMSNLTMPMNKPLGIKFAERRMFIIIHWQ